MQVLILGGTTEASAIAAGLAGHGGVRAVLSLAGRTRAPVLPAIPARRGGFGGADGLAAYLRDHDVAVLIDATHPFAVQISRNAVLAANAVGIPLLTVRRPEWTQAEGDRWTVVPDIQSAADALSRVVTVQAGGGGVMEDGLRSRHPHPGPFPEREGVRVFLTIGQQDLAPFAAVTARYLIRSVEPPDPALLPPGARLIAARGPFREADELALLRDEGVDVLVTKNSGGTATAPKLAAARALGIPVIMVARPPAPLILPGDVVPGEIVPDAGAALRWIDHAAAGWKRGV